MLFYTYSLYTYLINIKILFAPFLNFFLTNEYPTAGAFTDALMFMKELLSEYGSTHVSYCRSTQGQREAAYPRPR